MLTPLMGSFARYVVACVALLVAAFVLEGGLPRLTGRQWLATFVLGLVRCVRLQPVLHGRADQLPASRAALIIALNPVDHHRHFRRRCSRSGSARDAGLGWLWRCSAWPIVVSRGDFASFASGGVGAGELFMFAAVTSWALYTITRPQGARRAVAAGGHELCRALGNAVVRRAWPRRISMRCIRRSSTGA